MKVIKKKDAAGWTITCNCDACESTLLVSADDIYTFNDPDPRDGGIYFKSRCIECRAEFWVDRDKIPNYVKNYIQRPKSNGYWDR